MHTRKHTGGPRRRNNKAILILALILLLGLAIGGTVALLIDTTDDVANTFTPAKVEIAIEEKGYDGITKSSIVIQNPKTDDKVPCYVRVALVTNWVIAEGENARQICTNGHSTDVTFTPGDGWTKGGDGFYYYANPVPVGGKTSNLLGSDEIVLSQAQDGCKMQVEVVASAIQSTLGDTAQAAWAEAVK